MIYHESKKDYIFTVFRIIGNEMPPRDELNARDEVLKFILDNEPPLKNAKKCWMLNTIHDRIKREKYLSIFSEREMYTVYIPFNKKLFEEAKSEEEKIVHAIRINSARNFCIKHGKTMSRFTVVLDGDCIFTKDQWEIIHDQIIQDQKINRNRKYYSIPCSRSTMSHALISSEAMLMAEPMPVFRYDSEITFDEKIPFGKGDKLELLFRLNHNRETGKNYQIIDDSICKSVGLVHHVTASDYEIEKNTNKRIKLRDESIKLLLKKLEKPEENWPEYYSRSHNKPNVNWQKIQGWFDFRGLYSHFGWQLKDGDTFVEVGSWLGASAVYLAQEFVNRQKNIHLFCVDTWQGSNELEHKQKIAQLGGNENLYKKFLDNINESGLKNKIKSIRKSSIEASNDFEDNSLSVVFIDASHVYHDVINDLKSWYPKVKKGGIIAGHDYYPSHPISDIGVVPAVQKFFKDKNLETCPAGRTWLHRK